MPSGTLQERLALLKERGGPQAAAFRLLRAVAGLDVYAFQATELQRRAVPVLPEGCFLLELVSPADPAGLPASLIERLDMQTGCGVEATLQRGGRVYALLRGEQLLSQLKIEIGGSVVDTPCPLAVDVGEGNAFLSFLYTEPASRRGGWARRLIEGACASLAQEGFRHCVCHVQATNLRSLNTFRSLGWHSAAWLLAGRGGRLLGIVPAAGSGIRVRASRTRIGEGERQTELSSSGSLPAPRSRGRMRGP